MAGSNRKIKEISLGDDFGDVAVTANGVRVEIHADGSVLSPKKTAVEKLPPAAIRQNSPIPR